MQAQVLTTKLYAPPHRAGTVPRARLVERLDEGSRRALTLLSAPAGFGKTTLVSEWVAGRQRPTAWLSLDPDDRHLPRFLAHLVAALQTVEPGFGNHVLAALAAPQLPPVERLLTDLLNEAQAIEDDLVLVLDDIHVVDTATVEDVVSYLLERRPPTLHIVATTRADPNLRLSALRARGELVEIRAAELRFTADESAAFLDRVMGLELSPDAIAALESRTEGWIAGLQLAALSMRDCDDVPAFLRAFAGDHRFILDYLVDEVLARQPANVRDFLLSTSILDRLSGPLCDAVTGGEGSGERLDGLERRNLFLVPLDDQRRWYRFHRLFADMLRAHLRQERGDEVAELHARAFRWHAANGSPREAVRHALASGDTEAAAELIEGQWRAMDSTFQSGTWRSWVESLPAALVRQRPGLAVGYGWALLNDGELEAAHAMLDEAERALAAAGVSAEDQPSEHEDDGTSLRTLAGTAASARAYHDLAVGEPGASVEHAMRALELLPSDDMVGRGVPLGLLALAHWANGDLDDAYRMLDGAMQGFLAAGNVAAGLSGTFALAEIRVAQGRLREADRLYRQGLELVADAAPDLPGTPELHVGLAEVRCEQGDLEAADRHLRTAEGLGDSAVLPGDESRLQVAMARVDARLGRVSRAFDRLDASERLRIRSPMPELRPTAAWRAVLWARQGRLTEALGWAQRRGLPDPEDLRYLREFEQLAAVRVLLAAYDSEPSGDHLDGVPELLARLGRAAEHGERYGSLLEIRILQALVLRASGAMPAALTALGGALAIAEPQGFVGVFVDEGEPMRLLLREALKRKAAGSHARRVLAHLEKATGGAEAMPQTIEPLTDRERDVLRMLATDLSGPEIARHLGVSSNTIKTHRKNVYAKLDVSSRRAALRRARELGLL